MRTLITHVYTVYEYVLLFYRCLPPIHQSTAPATDKKFPVPVTSFSPASVELMRPQAYKNSKGAYIGLKAGTGWPRLPSWILGTTTPAVVAFGPRPTIDKSEVSAVRARTYRMPYGAKLTTVLTLSPEDEAALGTLFSSLTDAVHAARGTLFPAAHEAMTSKARANVESLLRLSSRSGAPTLPPDVVESMVEEASLALTRAALKKTPLTAGKPKAPREGDPPRSADAPPEFWPGQFRVSLAGYAPTVRSHSIRLNAAGYVESLDFEPTYLRNDGSTTPPLAAGVGLSEPTSFAFGVGHTKAGKVVVLPSVAVATPGVPGVVRTRVPAPLDLTPGIKTEVTFRVLLHVKSAGEKDGALDASWTATATHVLVWRSAPAPPRGIPDRYLVAADVESALAATDGDLVSDPRTTAEAAPPLPPPPPPSSVDAEDAYDEDDNDDAEAMAAADAAERAERATAELLLAPPPVVVAPVTPGAPVKKPRTAL